MKTPGLLLGMLALGCAQTNAASSPAAGAAPARDQTPTERALAKLATHPPWLFPALACPADVMGPTPQRTRYMAEHCIQDLGLCVDHCEAGQADGCYAAALRLQELQADAQYSEALFLRGCQLGHRSSCTNRAAGILMLDAPRAGRERCAFRSFELTCRDSDPWGCTMVGQLLAEGTGTAPDLDRALSALRQGCTFGEQDPACITAKRLITQIEASRAASPTAK
jgi:hypothetical protein